MCGYSVLREDLDLELVPLDHDYHLRDLLEH
jgi:hypothetical protein